MPSVRRVVHYHHLKPFYSICGFQNSCSVVLCAIKSHSGPLNFIFLLLQNKYLRFVVAANHRESKTWVKSSAMLVLQSLSSQEWKLRATWQSPMWVTLQEKHVHVDIGDISKDSSQIMKC